MNKTLYRMSVLIDAGGWAPPLIGALARAKRGHADLRPAKIPPSCIFTAFRPARVGRADPDRSLHDECLGGGG